jgi:hypothetical protein
VPFSSETRPACVASEISRDSRYLPCDLVRLASFDVITTTRSQKSLSRWWWRKRSATTSASPM